MILFVIFSFIPFPIYHQRSETLDIIKIFSGAIVYNPLTIYGA